MTNGIRTSDPRGFNKGRSSKFCEGSRVRKTLYLESLVLTESEQATPVVSIKDVVRSSVKVPVFEKHPMKAGGHIGRNVVKIIIKTKTIVQKPLL